MVLLHCEKSFQGEVYPNPALIPVKVIAAAGVWRGIATALLQYPTRSILLPTATTTGPPVATMVVVVGPVVPAPKVNIAPKPLPVKTLVFAAVSRKTSMLN